MDNGEFFKYVSIIEGFMIVAMLGWEIFWLRRMYQALQKMPTSQQLEDMLNTLKNDRDSIKNALSGFANMASPVMGMITSLVGGGSKKEHKEH